MRPEETIQNRINNIARTGDMQRSLVGDKISSYPINKARAQVRDLSMPVIELDPDLTEKTRDIVALTNHGLDQAIGSSGSILKHVLGSVHGDMKLHDDDGLKHGGLVFAAISVGLFMVKSVIDLVGGLFHKSKGTLGNFAALGKTLLSWMTFSGIYNGLVNNGKSQFKTLQPLLLSLAGIFGLNSLEKATLDKPGFITNLFKIFNIRNASHSLSANED